MTNAPSQPNWKVAIEEEMKALENNLTCQMVDLPRGKTHVGYKWMFTVKH